MPKIPEISVGIQMERSFWFLLIGIFGSPLEVVLIFRSCSEWNSPFHFQQTGFRVFKKKNPHTKQNHSEGNEGNDTIFQTIVTLIWNRSNFLPYRFLVFTSYFDYREHSYLTRETYCPCNKKSMQSYFSRSCRPPSSSSRRQRRIPGTQDSRPCIWLLSCRWFFLLAPKRNINSKFLQIFRMCNSRTLSTVSAHETSYLTTKTPLNSWYSEINGPTVSCIAARRITELLHLCSCGLGNKYAPPPCCFQAPWMLCWA